MGLHIYLLLAAIALGGRTAAHAAPQNSPEGRLVEVGTHTVFLNCTGNAPGATVILEAGSGDSSEMWISVQKQVEQFARVCSYDRLGLGKSEKVATRRTADEIVDDLHQLLRAGSIAPPYVMIGHSIGGIYVRKYAAQYPTEVSGMVLVDSAHEEQFARVSKISPEWAERIRKRFTEDDQRAGDS